MGRLRIEIDGFNFDVKNDLPFSEENSRIEFPVVLLREKVVLPQAMFPVSDQEDLVKTLAKKPALHSHVLVLTQLDGAPLDDFEAHYVAPIGVLAQIREHLVLSEAGQGTLLQGEGRVFVEQVRRKREGWVARVRLLDFNQAQHPRGLQVLARNLLTTTQRLVAAGCQFGREVRQAVDSPEEISQFVDLIVGHLSLTRRERQQMLTSVVLSDRVRLALGWMKREISLLKLSRSIDAKVKGEIDDEHRRHYLREQLSAIKRELGEWDDGCGEQERLVEELREMTFPAVIQRHVEEEIERFASMTTASSEYMIAHAYLQFLRELPWDSAPFDAPKLRHAHYLLSQKHFGIEKVKERILEYLALMLHSGKVPGSVLLLAGPPGVGKTSLAASIAEALGRPFVKIALGGVKDESEIRGHRRTYIGAMPGKIIQAVKAAGSRHAVILLDEIDKLGDERDAGLSAALLELLDPIQNASFTDHYLGIPFDLSRVLFVATANCPERLSDPLRERMELIDLPSYTEAEKLEIAELHIVPDLKRDMKLGRNFRLSRKTLSAVIRGYTEEAGVRQLKQELARLGRRVIKAQQERKKIAAINPGNLIRWLGVPRYGQEPKDLAPPPGVAIGLAYTEVGGELLHIETSRYGRFDQIGRHLFLTGSVGKVMQESAQTALSFLMAHAHLVGIHADEVLHSGIHLHLPDAATPKDGPSAGVAIMCAMASLLKGKSLPANLALTGEITLRGQVLGVGGIREKLTAAYRAGCHTVIIPGANERDLAELPREIRSGLQIIPVRSMLEVIQAVGLARGATATASTRKRMTLISRNVGG